MRIALRTSGGRGEYEIAGTQGNINRSALFDHEIILELVPGVRMKTGNVLKNLQGKPRLRLNTKADKHIYLLVAAALLLPKPKREIAKTSDSQVQIAEDDFAITSIQFDIVEFQKTEVIIRPTTLVLSNSSHTSVQVNVIERLRTVFDVWNVASSTTNRFSPLLPQHQQAFNSANVLQLLQISKDFSRLVSQTDPLKEILSSYALSDSLGVEGSISYSTTEPVIDDVDETNPEEAKIERIKEWRLQAIRGTQGQKFRSKVTQAYNFTCLFSGYYLPKTVYTTSAGVDAAHILPWAEYDLDSVSNGLCLNKLCHWAFDSGLLRLDFDKTKSLYILSIPDVVKAAGSNGEIDLTPFRPLEGPIPVKRLPNNRSLWPNPSFLEKFNQYTALT